MPNYNSPREITQYLKDHGLRANKRFGQNFLINPGARTLLLDKARTGNPRTIWEIGPGIGALTDGLAGFCDHLDLFEIDNGFVRLLAERFSDDDRVRVVPGDFVESWPPVRDREGDPDLIIGNLPYNSAAAMILSLYRTNCRARIICTVQKEVALRMTAKPGTASYSSYSVICQSGWQIKTLGNLKSGSFYPRPTVASTMLELSPRATPKLCRTFFCDFCRCLFASRRKTINNNLAACALIRDIEEAEIAAALTSLQIDPNLRSERLAFQVIERLAETCHDAIIRETRPSKDRAEGD